MKLRFDPTGEEIEIERVVTLGPSRTNHHEDLYRAYCPDGSTVDFTFEDCSVIREETSR